MTRAHISRLLLVSVLSFAGAASLRAQDADATLDAFFTQHLEEQFRLRPFLATCLGNHRYDNLIENLTPQSRAVWLDMSRKALADLPRQVDYQKLTRPSQIDFEIYQHSLTTDIWETENLHPFEQDPRVYNDYISDSIYLLLTQSTLPLETNIANCLARMALIPKVIATARDNLRNPPRVATETAISQNRGAIDFYEQDIFDFVGRTHQLPALKAAAAQVVQALKDYQKFLENDLLPRSNGDWRLGPDKFARKFDLELDAGMTADQVETDAETEFARVERDMYVIARQLWSKYYFKLPLPPDDEVGRRATVQKVLEAIAQDHGRVENLVRDTKQRVARLKKFITDTGFLPLPVPDRLQIIEMPEFRRGNSVAYLEAAPPLDPNAKAYLAVSPPPSDWATRRINSYLEEYNDHLLDVIAIHEGYPGHAVQLEYANRNPSLIRRVLRSGVYTEGWAVYTEQAMLDQGYGQGDLALRLSQLKLYLRSVANAVLDHKMHCANMTDDEALNFLVQQCHQSDSEARMKIIRAKESSCQLSTYFVGRMAIYRLRQDIERRQGDKFVLSDFHLAVLEPGAVPVKYLPEIVRSELAIPR